MKETRQPLSPQLWLAPLRGVTTRTFRATFSRQIREAGFSCAFAPFIPANPGLKISNRLFAELPSPSAGDIPLVPQVITRHPEAMRDFLSACRDRGFDRVDLNAGCPFPMIRRRGRGSGLLANPALLEKLVETGCEVLGPDKFSVKTRLGIERPDELLKLMPIFNRYPLAALTIHARTAKQMYEGSCDLQRFHEAAAASTNPSAYNGDVGTDPGELASWRVSELASFKGTDPKASGNICAFMIGRAFIRNLAKREDASTLLLAYIDACQEELFGDRPVLGRIKELLAYWAGADGRWHRVWPLAKICRSVGELKEIVK